MELIAIERLILATVQRFCLSSQVEHIIVKGHRACGGIKALMTMKEAPKTSDK
jgi:carbonic anhydrase